MIALSSESNDRRKDYISFLLVLFIFFTACNTTPGTKAEEPQKPGSHETPSADAAIKPAETVIAADIPADSIQGLLKGKWLRSDGTYTIEIFSVKEGGKMDAGYFNPNPINVGSSAWTISEGTILLEIILRDVNYPGSKYNLMYDRQKDLLMGNYFQAVNGINYDVMFTRNR